MTTLRTILKDYTSRLEQADVDSPRLSAEVLLAHAMGIERGDLLKKLLLDPETLPSPDAFATADAYIARRKNGEPVAYITGVKEFYGRDFHVNPATLIPRPDTETLVEAALAFAASYTPAPDSPATFADLGTGSGAIAVTLALELSQWRGIAVDISPTALAAASANGMNLGAKNLRFMHGDFTFPLFPPQSFDLIVSNPPYISETEYTTLSHEVRTFEPKTALVPPVTESDGLEHIRAVVHMAEETLKPNGLLLVEIGSTQGEAALTLVENPEVWSEKNILRDLAGLPRTLSAKRTANASKASPE